jgi:hypothetical protein
MQRICYYVLLLLVWEELTCWGMQRTCDGLLRQWNLLCDAMDVASSEQDFTARHTNDLAIGEGSLENLERVGVTLGVSKLRDNHGTVADEAVDIGRRKAKSNVAFTGLGRCRSKAPGIFLRVVLQ